MQVPFVRRTGSLLSLAALLFAASASAPLYAADPFVRPTQEELSMTSLPGYPGAAAMVLNRDEQTKDDFHVVQYYERVKILTEEGKKYANVELKFGSVRDVYYNVSDEAMIGEIVGRTIHPDGSIIPFTGKPFLKTLKQFDEGSLREKVFTLPDVTAGSIIEYRFTRRFSDSFYEPPDWYIQGPLFVRSAHYVWIPSQLVSDAISWFPVLPPGATIKTTFTPSASIHSNASTLYELTVHDVPPAPEEEHMPPIGEFSYRVLFNLTPYRSAEEYWKKEGRQWAKQVDNFIGSKGSLKEFVDQVTSGAVSEDDKLRKIYAAVMQFENTHLTRERDAREEKVSSAADVVRHKRGTPMQLTYTFVGLARAAGLKAYAALVPDRSKTIFVSQWLSFRQFDGEVAVVTVDGKEHFFDPGERYCPYGQLGWEHTLVKGLRQTAADSGFVVTPVNSYAANKTTRVANLTMDESGDISGKLDLTFSGAPALHWRQAALSGDTASLSRSLESEVEHLVPSSLEVRLAKIQNADDYEKPLIVNFTARGTMTTQSGKRLVLPADLFTSRDAATFTHEKRELSVYLHYPEAVIDAVRINLPKNFSVEAIPEATKLKWKEDGLYSLSVESAPSSVTTRRSFVLDEVIVPTNEYEEFRKFNSKLETKDKDTVVLKPMPVHASATAPPAPFLNERTYIHSF